MAAGTPFNSRAWSPTEAGHLRRALELAACGGGRTSPNPRVGAVLVRDGEVVGEGHHRVAGGPHAEVEALRRAGDRARGATLYVTLEPCNCQGRTPPCCPLVIESGVERVVAPMPDPNPRVNGSGFDELRRAGVRVEVGLLAREALDLNRGYLHRVATGRPYVNLKVATTLNGSIRGIRPGDRRITGERAQRHAHRLRARVQGLLIGRGTFEADQPRLDARKSEDPAYVPRRLILDGSLSFPENAPWIEAGEAATIVLFHREGAAPEKRRRLENLGVVTCAVAADETGRLDLGEVVARLGEWEMNEILVEGGERVLDSFLRRGRFERLYHYASASLGRWDDRGWYLGTEPPAWQESRPLRTVETRLLGEDLLRVMTRGWEDDYAEAHGFAGS